jgi:hypothetical protein
MKHQNIFHMDQFFQEYINNLKHLEPFKLDLSDKINKIVADIMEVFGDVTVSKLSA